jgi:pimeloyl-ACP methyl ester carboxylesterase
VQELAADVIAIADALGVGPFLLVGHDRGRLIAWHAAAGRPDRVRMPAASVSGR